VSLAPPSPTQKAEYVALPAVQDAAGCVQLPATRENVGVFPTAPAPRPATTKPAQFELRALVGAASFVPWTTAPQAEPAGRSHQMPMRAEARAAERATRAGKQTSLSVS